MSFQDALKLVLLWEGVYDLDPDDAGGETCFGITRVYQPMWKGWPFVADLKAAHIATSAWKDQPQLMQAVSDYYRNKWEDWRIGELPESLQAPMFGGMVNQGPSRCVRWLQESLKEMGYPVENDGNIGPATIAAACRASETVLYEKLWNKRARAYLVTANKPNQGKYLLGWMNRLQAGC